MKEYRIRVWVESPWDHHETTVEISLKAKTETAALEELKEWKEKHQSDIDLGRIRGYELRELEIRTVSAQFFGKTD